VGSFLMAARRLRWAEDSFDEESREQSNFYRYICIRSLYLFASEWIEGSAQDRKPNHT